MHIARRLARMFPKVRHVRDGKIAIKKR